MGLLPDTFNCGLCMRQECRELFPLPPRVTDPEMHHGTCVTHVPWCMPGSSTGVSFEVDGGEMFPAFPVHAQPAISRIWWETNRRGDKMFAILQRTFPNVPFFLAKKPPCRQVLLIYLTNCARQAIRVPFYWNGFTLIPAWISNCIH